MKKLVSFLNSKWSAIIAFVPVVNVAYLLFWFLTEHEKKYDISLWSLLIVAPLCLLYHFVPAQWGWLVTHLIFSVIVLLVLHKARGGHKAPVQIKLRWEIIFVCSLLLVGFVMSQVTLPGDELIGSAKDATKLALIAFVNNDEEIWNRAIHPVYGPAFKDVSSIKNSVLASGISNNNYFLSSAVVEEYEVNEGTAISVEFTVNISTETPGDVERYKIKVIYQDSENGNGLIEIKSFFQY